MTPAEQYENACRRFDAAEAILEASPNPRAERGALHASNHWHNELYRLADIIAGEHATRDDWFPFPENEYDPIPEDDDADLWPDDPSFGLLDDDTPDLHDVPFR